MMRASASCSAYFLFASGSEEMGEKYDFVKNYPDEMILRWPPMWHGVDVWLNNPQPPLEASGTSGMKASLNGIPHLSVLDGWWIEGYNRRSGWAVPNGGARE